MILEFYKEYPNRPSEIIDPCGDYSEARRDMIDFAYMKNGKARIMDILTGKRPMSNNKPFRSDPFPKPSNFEELKRRGGKIWQKLARESGWL